MKSDSNQHITAEHNYFVCMLWSWSLYVASTRKHLNSPT